MKKILIKSLKELEQYKKNPGSIQFYRGESKKYETPIMSGINRNDFSINQIKKKEEEIFKLFSRKISTKEIIVNNPYTSELKYYNEWYWLCQAQHLKLKTRLIDFTVDMKVALFFAVNECKYDDEEGHFWIFNCPEEIKINENKFDKIFHKHPFECIDSFMINPVIFQNDDVFLGEKRMIRQYGRFFVQSIENGKTPLFKQDKFKNCFHHFIIEPKYKQKIRKELVDSCFLSDWIYYKNDFRIDAVIKNLNEICF